MAGGVEMSDELKPCPFCGSQPFEDKYQDGFREKYVYCRNSACPNANKHIAKQRWNTRPSEYITIKRSELESMRKLIPAESYVGSATVRKLGFNQAIDRLLERE